MLNFSTQKARRLLIMKNLHSPSDIGFDLVIQAYPNFSIRID